MIDKIMNVFRYFFSSSLEISGGYLVVLMRSGATNCFIIYDFTYVDENE